jgi:hypothetical protein
MRSAGVVGLRASSQVTKSDVGDTGATAVTPPNVGSTGPPSTRGTHVLSASTVPGPHVTTSAELHPAPEQKSTTIEPTAAESRTRDIAEASLCDWRTRVYAATYVARSLAAAGDLVCFQGCHVRTFPLRVSGVVIIVTSAGFR